MTIITRHFARRAADGLVFDRAQICINKLSTGEAVLEKMVGPHLDAKATVPESDAGQFVEQWRMQLVNAGYFETLGTF